jgi:hypothetical protein
MLENACYEEDSEAIIEAIELIESQAREIATLKTNLVTEECLSFRKQLGDPEEQCEELRAALVESIAAFEKINATRVMPATIYGIAAKALTRCKEVLK